MQRRALTLDWQQLGADEYTSEIGRVVLGGHGEWWFFPSIEIVPCKPGEAAQSGPYDSHTNAIHHAEQLCAPHRKEANV